MTTESPSNQPDVPIPALLQDRPRYRGIPIPAMVCVSASGVPDFAVTDPEAWAHVVSERLCGLCGTRLDDWIWFIGGPLCVGNRLFTDPPMHEACARYALRVCPYLAGKKGHDPHPEARPLARERGVHVDPAVSAVRPPQMALLRCRDYDIVVLGEGVYLRASPFQAVEWREPTAEAPGDPGPAR